ncbi:MAG: AbrB/MazE/SpoVT family DNA-binding domain-containing protein [Ruminococcaceae bacterium]|nr:AbrB/MazE/SpoVT family DNA-binding domain-containing protein [Oscillospiraceae bacterium]
MFCARFVLFRQVGCSIMYLWFEIKTNNAKEVMKMSIEMIRRIDGLGRIVIPKDIRIALGLRLGESVAITVENNVVILKKS